MCMERESALPHKSRNINQESGLSVTLCSTDKKDW